MLTRVKTTRGLTRALSRPTALLGAGLLAASLTLTGCSGNSTEAYCDEVVDTKSDFDGLEAADAGNIGDAFDAYERLGEKAPKEVEDDWEIVLDDVREFQRVLDDVGLGFDDLDSLSTGEMPEGFDLAKLQEVGEATEGLNGEEFNDAMEAIEEHAEEECGVDLTEE